ncbi:MAG: hypothetical protein EXR67_01950 [Dehalococcoidia bacterium]|nr:hypothetical protein [Dehalococcoidia bacterium]
MSRNWLIIFLVAAMGLPALGIRILNLMGAGVHMSPAVAVMVFGGGIIAAAFVISWAAEAAQMDISATLALAFLALIAVLPEYSVDALLAWKAGQDPAGDYVHFATANMTGANRLLVGLGWPLVMILFWFKRRRALFLEHGISLELVFLSLASLYALTIPFKSAISVYDGVLLVTFFVAYMWISGKQAHSEPELMGPAAAVGNLKKRMRRTTVTVMFIYCATVIIASAEPFVEGLLELGKSVGVDEFFLIQWVAPLASETPEILVAVIFTLRGHAGASMTTLISAMVNQWTLLVATLPFVFSISAGQWTLAGIPMDPRQQEEVWLTAAQSVFAIVLLLKLRIGGLAGITLLVLWGSQLLFTETSARYVYIAIYLIGAVGLLLVDRERLKAAIKLVPDILNILRRPVAETTHK